MKKILQHIALFSLLFSADAFAQDVTTVRANNSDISDNLDLKAVASIFGDSQDLEDFERRLNDPDLQISNLDLNGDNQVDYLRVVEATENNIHLIIIQSVLGPDTFQDIATIEVDRDRNNNVQVQVVGDVYMYGSNYTYQPVYISRPAIYDVFWVNTYRPYYSPWYWGYYPTYYNYWAPYPVYTYRRRVRNHINVRNNYVYVNTRGSSRAENLYNSRRQNAYERQHPNNSFSSRNKNVSNRYALEQNRSNAKATRSAGSTRSSFSNSSRSNSLNASKANSTKQNRKNRYSNSSVRNVNSPARSTNNAVRNSASQPAKAVQYTAPARSNNIQRSAPVQQQAPIRQSTPAPVQRSTPAPVQRSTPSAAPARQSTPVMRSTPSAPVRQSTPAPGRAAGGNSRRG